MIKSRKSLICMVIFLCAIVVSSCSSNKNNPIVSSTPIKEETAQPTPEVEPTPELSRAELEQIAYDELINGEISRRQEYEFIDIKMPEGYGQTYEVYEIAFDITAEFEGSDKYSSNVVDINGYFLLPDGQTEKMPAFYKKDDGLHWALRYNPRVVGEYTFYLKDEINGTITEEYTFVAKEASENRGFLVVDGNKFIDSYGKQFTLLGTNFAWGRIEEFEEALPLYKEHSMNYMRFWSQCDWSAFSLESAAGTYYEGGFELEFSGLGDYNLDSADRMDWLIEEFQNNDVYMQFCLFNLWDYNEGHWDRNAYNEANGGPCTWDKNRTDIWTDPVAINYQKQLIRYIYSRYGSYRALAVFELWNECDNKVAAKKRSIRDEWNSTMDSYFKSLDIYNHPVTTSYAWTDHPSFNDEKTASDPWKSQEFFDLADPHSYIAIGKDPVPLWIEQFEFTNTQHPGDKPVFMGEYSEEFIEMRENSDSTERYFALGIWAPIFFSDTAGSNLFWRVDTKFLPSENMLDYMQVAASIIQPYEDKLHEMKHVYGGIIDNVRHGYYTDETSFLLFARDENTLYTDEEATSAIGDVLEVEGLGNGTYKVEFYNIYTGEIVGSKDYKSSDGIMNLELPAFERNIVAIGKRK